MNLKLSAFCAASLLVFSGSFAMNNDNQDKSPRAKRAARRNALREQREKDEQAANDVAPSMYENAKKLIKENRAVQLGIVAFGAGTSAYALTQPVTKTITSLGVKRILLNSSTARWISMATWNLIYDNCPACADFLLFNGLI